MTQHWQLSAAEIAAGVRHGHFTSEEVVHNLLARIDRVEPSLHAWETVDAEGALAEARRLDQVQASGATLPPLHGVPIGFKDIYNTRGLRTTMGSSLYRDFVPTFDAAAVERLRQAGAVVLGKTVSTPFAFMDPAATRNPWDLDHTPGSSSSGAGAAVAARTVPISLGSQTGGSTLRPASYCGVVGFKPSFGRVSLYGVLQAAWTMDHVGVIVRTVEDAALFLQATAGYDPRDQRTLDEPVDDYLAPLRQPAPPRLALLRDYLDRSTAPMREHLEALAEGLEEFGAEVVEVRLPIDLDLLFSSQIISIVAEGAAAHATLFAQHPEAYSPRMRGLFEANLLMPAATYIRAQVVRRGLRQVLDGLLADVDALLLPTAADQAPLADTTGDSAFQTTASFAGLPSISLPTGLSPDGLPLGSQLVGRHFQEGPLLGAARWIEHTQGFVGGPPELPVT